MLLIYYHRFYPGFIAARRKRYIIPSTSRDVYT